MDTFLAKLEQASFLQAKTANIERRELLMETMDWTFGTEQMESKTCPVLMENFAS